MALELSGSINISGSMTATTIVVSSPGVAGMVSSSAQIGELVPLMQSTSSINNLTGSLITTSSNNVIAIDGLNTYTASIKGATIVSSSQQIQNYFTFAQTASANTFYGNQTINGTLGVSIGGIESMALTSDGYLGIGKNSLNVSVDDLIGLLAFKSNDTSTNSAGAISSIRSYATANYNTGNVEGDMRFYVSNGSVPNGSLLSGNEHTRLTKDGYLRLAGGGIQFNGDTAAANALNDYEEGTFTPIVQGQSSGTPTYIAQNGYYVKIGKICVATLLLDYQKNTMSGGTLQVGGFPFVCANLTNHLPQAPVMLDNLATTLTNPVAQLFLNSTIADLIAANGSTGNHAGLGINTYLGAGTMTLRLTMTYRTT